MSSMGQTTPLRHALLDVLAIGAALCCSFVFGTLATDAPVVAAATMAIASGILVARAEVSRRFSCAITATAFAPAVVAFSVRVYTRPVLEVPNPLSRSGGVVLPAVPVFVLSLALITALFAIVIAVWTTRIRWRRERDWTRICLGIALLLWLAAVPRAIRRTSIVGYREALPVVAEVRPTMTQIVSLPDGAQLRPECSKLAECHWWFRLPSGREHEVSMAAAGVTVKYDAFSQIWVLNSNPLEAGVFAAYARNGEPVDVLSFDAARPGLGPSPGMMWLGLIGLTFAAILLVRGRVFTGLVPIALVVCLFSTAPLFGGAVVRILP